MKHCNKCDATKPLSGFNKASKTRDGYYTQCKECVKTARAGWAPQSNPEKERKRGLMRHFNMTVEEYEAMFNAQGGCCAICQRPEWRTTKKGAIIMLAVDHDHRCCPGRSSCGECVRALLCTDCNTAMGLMNENVIRMNRMVDYVTKYNGNVTIDENQVF